MTRSARLIGLAALVVALPAVTAETAPKPGPNTPSTASKVDARIARRGGYRVVERDGDTLYCRKELKTGSLVVKVETCLTAQQLAELNEATQRSL